MALLKHLLVNHIHINRIASYVNFTETYDDSLLVPLRTHVVFDWHAVRPPLSPTIRCVKHRRVCLEPRRTIHSGRPHTGTPGVHIDRLCVCVCQCAVQSGAVHDTQYIMLHSVHGIHIAKMSVLQCEDWYASVFNSYSYSSVYLSPCGERVATTECD